MLKKMYHEERLKKSLNDAFRTWSITKSLLPSSRKLTILEEVKHNAITHNTQGFSYTLYPCILI